jgi:hypothetical protein
MTALTPVFDIRHFHGLPVSTYVGSCTPLYFVLQPSKYGETAFNGREFRATGHMEARTVTFQCNVN